jgi:ABC-2 type transport system ATP-binding protein
VILIRNLQKAYDKTQALAGIDLEVPAGELFAYLGPNGAGKTTTIRILTGLTRLSGGRASLNGHDIEKEPLAAKKQYGLVPQHINLDSELTVYENLMVHGRLYHMPRQAIVRRIDELLAYIELQEKRHTPVKQLSGGMKRRVMIARALIHAPRMLFLDEPTVGLDAAIRRRIWALIKRIQQDGVTVFLTTHYIEEAEFLADRVAFLDQGRIVALDSPHRLMEGLGQWAIDYFDADNMHSLYFAGREEANQHVLESKTPLTLRRVNLEDAFLHLTGKKVQ